MYCFEQLFANRCILIGQNADENFEYIKILCEQFFNITPNFKWPNHRLIGLTNHKNMIVRIYMRRQLMTWFDDMRERDHISNVPESMLRIFYEEGVGRFNIKMLSS